ncbi:hypothetical protein STEG23_036259, partial [Scotinomys teguina]
WHILITPLVAWKRNSCHSESSQRPLPRTEEYQCSFQNFSLHVSWLLVPNRKM